MPHPVLERYRDRSDLEAGFSPQDHSQGMRLHKIQQHAANPKGNYSVPRSGGRHHNQFSLHQFASPKLGGVEQLLGGRDLFNRSHD